MGPIDHLNLDAVVAFADGEMSMVAYQRAAAHVMRCPQCDAEVKAQMTARSWLRSAESPAMPTSLLDALRSIPVALPASPDDRSGVDRSRGGGHQPPGPWYPRTTHRSRRFRFLGAGALVAGLTVGALVASEPVTGSDPRPDNAQIAHVSPVSGPQVATAGWGNP